MIYIQSSFSLKQYDTIVNSLLFYWLYIEFNGNDDVYYIQSYALTHVKKTPLAV